MKLFQATAAGVAVALAIIAIPARAQIPAPCIELATRENIPIETETQIAAAERRLWRRFNLFDALVWKCRAEVKALKAAKKANAQ